MSDASDDSTPCPSTQVSEELTVDTPSAIGSTVAAPVRDAPGPPGPPTHSQYPGLTVEQWRERSAALPASWNSNRGRQEPAASRLLAELEQQQQPAKGAAGQLLDFLTAPTWAKRQAEQERRRSRRRCE